MEIKKKIIHFKDINNNLKNINNKKIVLVGGCFDIFHFGHLKFLINAKKQGDFLIIALESDEFIKKIKKRQPIHHQKQRAEILASLFFVDLVILLPFFDKESDYLNLIKKVKPSIIAVTEGDLKIKNKKEQSKKAKAKLVVVTKVIKSFSTTNILKTLKF